MFTKKEKNYSVPIKQVLYILNDTFHTFTISKETIKNH